MVGWLTPAASASSRTVRPGCASSALTRCSCARVSRPSDPAGTRRRARRSADRNCSNARSSGSVQAPASAAASLGTCGAIPIADEATPPRVRIGHMAEQKWVYDFAEGSKDMRELLGGKGANVAEMTRVLGPDRMPAGFTITTEACVAYMKAGQQEPEGMAEEVAAALERLQEHTGKRLGDNDDPLLVSVRSGARESMPGMLDTVLNLGINDKSVEGL